MPSPCTVAGGVAYLPELVACDLSIDTTGGAFLRKLPGSAVTVLDRDAGGIVRKAA